MRWNFGRNKTWTRYLNIFEYSRSPIMNKFSLKLLDQSWSNPLFSGSKRCHCFVLGHCDHLGSFDPTRRLSGKSEKVKEPISFREVIEKHNAGSTLHLNEQIFFCVYFLIGQSKMALDQILIHTQPRLLSVRDAIFCWLS